MTYVLERGKFREIMEKFDGLKGKVVLYLFTGDKVEHMDLVGVVPEKEVVNKILESIYTQDYAY